MIYFFSSIFGTRKQWRQEVPNRLIAIVDAIAKPKKGGAVISAMDSHVVVVSGDKVETLMSSARSEIYIQNILRQLLSKTLRMQLFA